MAGYKQLDEVEEVVEEMNLLYAKELVKGLWRYFHCAGEPVMALEMCDNGLVVQVMVVSSNALVLAMAVEKYAENVVELEMVHESDADADAVENIHHPRIRIDESFLFHRSSSNCFASMESNRLLCGCSIS